MDDIINQMAAAEKLKSLAAAARDFYRRGDWTAAKEASAELAAASRIVGNRLHLQEALMVEGLLLYREGQWDGALERFKEQESICRDLLLRPLLVGSLGNQALVLSRCDDPEKAESALRLFEEAEQICRQDRGPEDAPANPP